MYVSLGVLLTHSLTHVLSSHSHSHTHTLAALALTLALTHNEYNFFFVCQFFVCFCILLTHTPPHHLTHCPIDSSLTHHHTTHIQEMLELAKTYNKAIQDEEKLSKEKLAIANVGKMDPKRHLTQDVEQLMTSNIVQTLGTMLNTVTF